MSKEFPDEESEPVEVEDTPEEALDNDEMNSAEAGFMEGFDAESDEEEEKEEKEDEFDI